MSYTRTNWENGVTPLNAINMNNIENGIAELNTRISGLIDIFYPVGSYYETSDASFDPNNAWEGTWVLESEGSVHIGAGSNYTLGATGGEATHSLTVDEMPRHGHSVKANISAAFAQGINGHREPAMSNETSTNPGWAVEVGGGQAHNNMPPYVVVNRWHRTA